MSIARTIDHEKGTVVLTYGGNPLTPELDMK